VLGIIGLKRALPVYMLISDVREGVRIIGPFPLRTDKHYRTLCRERLSDVARNVSCVSMWRGTLSDRSDNIEARRKRVL